VKSRDLVYLWIGHRPTVGEIVGFTPKRVRVAVRSGTGYISVLRSKNNIKVARKTK
jgi:hypothetical protein